MKIFKKAIKRLNDSLTVIIVLGIIVMVNVISHQFSFRADLTDNKDYSISKATKRTVASLDDVVNIKTYFSRNLPPKYLNLQQEVMDMLDEYENNDGTPGKLDRAAIQQGLWTVEDLWGKKEPRFFATIYTQGTPWQGSTLDFHRGLRLADGSITMESVAGIPAYGLNYRKDEPAMGTSGVLKYLNPTFNNKNQEPISNVALIVFRYGEILLNHAEAAFETGKTDIALNAINQIRSRAGVPPLTQISMDKIKHERKIELAFEGHRYWDIRRWRTAVNDLTRYFAGLRYILDVETKKLQLQVIENDHGSITSPTFYEYNYYLPITLARTGSNPNLVENPGY